MREHFSPQPWHKLRCPYCRGSLVLGSESTSCNSCEARFPAVGERYADLLPIELLGNGASAWEARQAECDRWYTDLVQRPEAAVHCLTHDYAPFRAYLSDLEGDVLDIGGGIGVVRQWLPTSCTYVSLEPSTEWLATAWSAAVTSLPGIEEPPFFVRGIGEHLPFGDATFDAVLSFWSLNHVADPARVISETARVLKPDGKALLVLEDMPPRWSDLLGATYRTWGARYWLASAWLRISLAVRGRPWPLQTDHVRIDEPALLAWVSRDFEVVARVWCGRYLSYELQRCSKTRV